MVERHADVLRFTARLAFTLCCPCAVWAQSGASTTPTPADTPVEPAPASATGEPQPEAEQGQHEKEQPPTTPVGTVPAASAADDALRRLSQELDQILISAAQDLSLPLAYLEKTRDTPIDEQALAQHATEGWALSARLRWEGGQLWLRIAAVRPGQRVVLVRSERVAPEQLEVRTMMMMRDLSRVGAGTPPPQTRRPTPPPQPLVPSRGKATLAVTGALTGAYVGFAVEHIGGRSDGALVYPLMTLGAGVGVGASIVVAEEWDVDNAEAWYLSAASWWPTTAAVLIADSTDLKQTSDRYAYGLIGTASGLSLATLALSLGELQPGGAVVTHSGAMFGMLYGGLGELMIEGETEESPTLGLGVGMAAGVAVSGALATQIQAEDSDVLFVDLGAVLGGLAGAAVASPAIVGDRVSSLENRVWLGSIAAGTLAGGLVALLFTPESGSETANFEVVDGGRAVAPHQSNVAELHWRPYFESVTFGGQPGARPWVFGAEASY